MIALTIHFQRSWLRFAALLPLLLSLALAAQAQEPPRGRSPGKRSGKASRRPADVRVTAEQVAAVNALVRTHHPELATLLAQLRESRPSQYTQAVRNLFRTSVRLAAIQERDMDRYALELRRWKLESQSQLLALRAAQNADNAALERALREINEQLLETRIALLELERSRQQARLRRLERHLSELKNSKTEQVDNAVQERLRAARQLVKARARARAKSSQKTSKSTEGAKRKRAD